MTEKPGVSRRGFIVLTAGGLGGLLATGVGAAAPAFAAPTPKLPAEYYRKANQTTPAGTLFDNINVRINGDVARIHVPQTVKPGGAPVDVVWFYHGSGSDHNALDGGFKKDSAAVVDRGAIAICQTAGGTLYSHPTAVAIQIAGTSYMRDTFNVRGAVLRSTSGGGALATETYARRLVGNIKGMYNVNSVYDLRAFYDAGGGGKQSVVNAFGDDPDAIDAANPARHRQSAWADTTMRIVVSQPDSSDTTVPPAQHGKALRNLALPVAKEASLLTHSNGHTTPLIARPDFIDSMNRWLGGGGAPAGDRTAPTAVITAPAEGAVLSGYATITVKATDNVGVTDVAIFVAGKRMLTLTKQSAEIWGARLWTKTSQTPNGKYALTARATDAAGNVGVSAPVNVRVAN